MYKNLRKCKMLEFSIEDVVKEAYEQRRDKLEELIEYS
jgi:predicted CopG family antitoxin